jgi:hypothetical protein
MIYNTKPKQQQQQQQQQQHTRRPGKLCNKLLALNSARNFFLKEGEQAKNFVRISHVHISLQYKNERGIVIVCSEKHWEKKSARKMLRFSTLKQAIRKVKCYSLTFSHTDLNTAYCDVQANFLMVTIHVRHFQDKIFLCSVVSNN